MNPNRIKHLADTEGGVCKVLKYLMKSLDHVTNIGYAVIIIGYTREKGHG